MALVVFLRGVNVGGHRTVRPTMLAQQLKRYDVVNIGAAGTFVVRRPIREPASGGIRAQIAIPGRNRHLPRWRASGRGFRSSVWGCADSLRCRSFRERVVSTAPPASPTPRCRPSTSTSSSSRPKNSSAAEPEQNHQLRKPTSAIHPQNSTVHSP